MKAAERLVRLAAYPGRSRRLWRRMSFPGMEIRRIWMHKPDHLGDAVLTRPALHMLRARWPEAEIRVACHPAAAPLLAADGFAPEPWSSPFLDGDGSLWQYRRRVRRFKPDLLINLRHDFRDILFCVVLRTPCLITYDHRGCAALASHGGSSPDERTPEAQNHADLLQETIALKPVATPALVPPPAAMAKASEIWGETTAPIIALHAAARTAAKTWPVTHWRSLIALLRKRFAAAPILLGEGRDRDINVEIGFDFPGIRELSGKLTLIETAAVIAQADLLIGIDSGPGHIAAAVGTPVVSIMSGTNHFERWAPDANNAVRYPVPCAPCRAEVCAVAGHPCLQQLEPSTVLAAAERLLAK